MPRYIDAEAVERDFQEWRNLFSWEDGATERAVISRAIQTLQSQPTADVVERKIGKWVKQNPFVDTEECSLCKYNIYSEELETPFCPWCGAEMETNDAKIC